MSANDDLVRLRHMLEAAQVATEFIQGETRESLDKDRKLVFAVVRAIEIVGEAASKVSPGFRDAHPLIPWKVIVGMRNWVIHAYFDVNLDIVWDTATKNLPALIVELEKLIPPEK
jgi:uncharacterized protein with HEPN domain